MTRPFLLSLVFLVTGIATTHPAEQSAASKIDLRTGARIVVSHATPGEEFRIENAIDGDPETKWVGESHPLSFQPANIVIEFAQPQVIEKVVLLSTMFRERLALKDVELYARAGQEWAGETPLAKTQATNISTTIEFSPVQTTALRIRVRSTWREDNTYPRIHEIEVHRAGAGKEASTLRPGAIADEKGSERFVLRRAMGVRYVAPGTKFDPAKGYVGYVREFLDTMILEGGDRYGRNPSPMFASILDLESHRIPEDIPANIEGQRYGDRALRGGNLMHDVMLLQACGLLSEISGANKYARLKRDYLVYFLKNCPQKTGLFPWGEHAYWNFFDEKPGAPVHEFLGGPPRTFWEDLWAIDPAAVRREADGLINHVTDLNNFHFDRHADDTTPLPDPRPPGGGGLDFPRHAGFYMHVWGFAYAKTQDEKYARWINKMIDHHWPHRRANGLLPSTTRGGQARIATAESTLSLAVSLLETAAMLPAGELKERCQKVGREYLRAVASLPHKPAEGKFLASITDNESGEPTIDFGEPYRYGYGGGFTADNACLLLAAHRLTGEERLLKLGEEFAQFYSRNDPPPAHEIVRAHVYGSIIGLFTDLYALTGKIQHLQQAERYAVLSIERLFHNGLFRGATAIDHYEGDLMPGNVVYNLLWLDSVKKKSNTEIPPNYFNR